MHGKARNRFSSNLVQSQEIMRATRPVVEGLEDRRLMSVTSAPLQRLSVATFLLDYRFKL